MFFFFFLTPNVSVNACFTVQLLLGKDGRWVQTFLNVPYKYCSGTSLTVMLTSAQSACLVRGAECRGPCARLCDTGALARVARTGLVGGADARIHGLDSRAETGWFPVGAPLTPSLVASFCCLSFPVSCHVCFLEAHSLTSRPAPRGL